LPCSTRNVNILNNIEMIFYGSILEDSS